MAEGGTPVNHSTFHRRILRLLSPLEKAFRRHKRTVCRNCRVDETYIKINVQWKDLYRAVDKVGHTVDFVLRTRQDKVVMQRCGKDRFALNCVPKMVMIGKKRREQC